MDILHPRARAAGQYRVVSYDSDPTGRSGSGAAVWKEWLTATTQVNPADAAAFRIDLSSWLASLPERRRRTAELLGLGYGTLEVAKALGVTAAAVSQARAWLETSWRRYQGESLAALN
jgi:hypothetical protein